MDLSDAALRERAIRVVQNCEAKWARGACSRCVTSALIALRDAARAEQREGANK